MPRGLVFCGPVRCGLGFLQWGAVEHEGIQAAFTWRGPLRLCTGACYEREQSVVREARASAHSWLALTEPRSLSCSVQAPRDRSCSHKCKALLQVAEEGKDYLPPTP